MIETVQHLATAGGIERIRGLLNATTTFILAAMGEGRSYDAALAEAQEAGYAEPDPTFDVTGRDAAQKIAILASVAWGRWLPEHEVATRGIVGIRVEPGETQRLVAEADEQGRGWDPWRLARTTRWPACPASNACWRCSCVREPSSASPARVPEGR